jgi:hypothetical protein
MYRFEVIGGTRERQFAVQRQGRNKGIHTRTFDEVYSTGLKSLLEQEVEGRHDLVGEMTAVVDYDVELVVSRKIRRGPGGDVGGII